MARVKPNIRSGGSYIKNPESGELTLVKQTEREKNKHEAKREKNQNKAEKTAKATKTNEAEK